MSFFKLNVDLFFEPRQAGNHPGQHADWLLELRKDTAASLRTATMKFYSRLHTYRHHFANGTFIDDFCIFPWVVGMDEPGDSVLLMKLLKNVARHMVKCAPVLNIIPTDPKMFDEKFIINVYCRLIALDSSALEGNVSKPAQALTLECCCIELEAALANVQREEVEVLDDWYENMDYLALQISLRTDDYIAKDRLIEVGNRFIDLGAKKHRELASHLYRND